MGIIPLQCMVLVRRGKHFYRQLLGWSIGGTGVMDGGGLFMTNTASRRNDTFLAMVVGIYTHGRKVLDSWKIVRIDVQEK